jgi:hypothetical protein
MEALLRDAVLADAVWELWDAGVFTDSEAAWVWSILSLDHDLGRC